MKIKGAVRNIIRELGRLYPHARCTLDYGEPWQLALNARLAAQCTDARVNIVAKSLYARYPTLESIAAAEMGALEALVRPTGFYHRKAEDIKCCAAMLCEKHSGGIPDDMESLLALPGIGRKTANLLLGELHGKSAVVADTHCIRLSRRFGFTTGDDPYKVEMTLREILPEREQLPYCHRVVSHGRAVCLARSPRCGVCALRPWCGFTG
ncbi:MAG: endonuclease III [Oscillospiraceae bacterium]|nr:endonuclease III [Oscillospiraceae bacterium]